MRLTRKLPEGGSVQWKRLQLLWNTKEDEEKEETVHHGYQSAVHDAMMLCHVSILYKVQSIVSFFWSTEHVINVTLGRKYKQV